MPNVHDNSRHYRFLLVENFLSLMAARCSHPRRGHSSGWLQLSDIRHLVSPNFPARKGTPCDSLFPPTYPMFVLISIWTRNDDTPMILTQPSSPSDVLEAYLFRLIFPFYHNYISGSLANTDGLYIDAATPAVFRHYQFLKKTLALDDNGHPSRCSSSLFHLQSPRFRRVGGGVPSSTSNPLDFVAWEGGIPSYTSNSLDFGAKEEGTSLFHFQSPRFRRVGGGVPSSTTNPLDFGA